MKSILLLLLICTVVLAINFDSSEDFKMRLKRSPIFNLFGGGNRHHGSSGYGYGNGGGHYNQGYGDYDYDFGHGGGHHYNPHYNPHNNYGHGGYGGHH